MLPQYVCDETFESVRRERRQGSGVGYYVAAKFAVATAASA